MSDFLPAVPEPGTPISADEVAALERFVAENVAQVEDIAGAVEWRAQAAALEAYLRSRDMQRPMLGAQRRVEARIGQLLGEAKLGRPIGKSHRDEISHSEDRATFRLLARVLDGECSLTPDEWRKSRRALVSLVRNRLGLMPETPPLPDGIFNCVVADPPWRLDTGPDVFGGTGESGHDALAYEQMPLEEIKALEVEALAAPDAHLYLWTTNRYLEDAYDVVRAWGFKPSVVLVWCKTPRGVGLGDTYRLTTEYVLFARRGSLPHRQIVPTTWFEWPRGRHSAKPREFYELVESVTPGPYLELFAREARANWESWGEEAPERAAA